MVKGTATRSGAVGFAFWLDEGLGSSDIGVGIGMPGCVVTDVLSLVVIAGTQEGLGGTSFRWLTGPGVDAHVTAFRVQRRPPCVMGGALLVGGRLEMG